MSSNSEEMEYIRFDDKLCLLKKRNALLSNVGRLVNNKFRDVIEIVVACRQTVDPKLFHSSDNQRIVGKESMNR
jgi:hypothetical protein